MFLRVWYSARVNRKKACFQYKAEWSKYALTDGLVWQTANNQMSLVTSHRL